MSTARLAREAGSHLLPKKTPPSSAARGPSWRPPSGFLHAGMSRLRLRARGEGRGARGLLGCGGSGGVVSTARLAREAGSHLLPKTTPPSSAARGPSWRPSSGFRAGRLHAAHRRGLG